jgi:hypothetical protein
MLKSLFSWWILRRSGSVRRRHMVENDAEELVQLVDLRRGSMRRRVM